jgi:hypothetical protein
MQIIDVPVYNDDGSVQFTQKVSPEEAQHLLTFAINFLASAGWALQKAKAEQQVELND